MQYDIFLANFGRFEIPKILELKGLFRFQSLYCKKGKNHLFFYQYEQLCEPWWYEWQQFHTPNIIQEKIRPWDYFTKKKMSLHSNLLPAFTEVNNRSINVNFSSEVSVACISQMFLLFFFPRLLKKVHTCGLLWRSNGSNMTIFFFLFRYDIWQKLREIVKRAVPRFYNHLLVNIVANLIRWQPMI